MVSEYTTCCGGCSGTIFLFILKDSIQSNLRKNNKISYQSIRLSNNTIIGVMI